MGDRPSSQGLASNPTRTVWIGHRVHSIEHPDFPPIPERCSCGAALHGYALERVGGGMVCCADCGTDACRCVRLDG